MLFKYLVRLLLFWVNFLLELLFWGCDIDILFWGIFKLFRWLSKMVFNFELLVVEVIRRFLVDVEFKLKYFWRFIFNGLDFIEVVSILVIVFVLY